MSDSLDLASKWLHASVSLSVHLSMTDTCRSQLVLLWQPKIFGGQPGVVAKCLRYVTHAVFVVLVLTCTFFS